MKFITIFIYVFVCTFLVSCKEATSSKRECKGTHVNVDVINNIGFKSVFAKNGIYVNLIPMEDDSYALLVSIANYTDTLDYYLNSKTERQSVPKILFGTDYVLLLTGSSSYRYATLSYLDKRFDKIITRKYTTSRDVSSNIDGAVFFKEKYCYLYDFKEHKMRRMHPNFNLNSLNEARLFNGDSILIIGDGESEKCKKRDFSMECKLLSPTIIR